MSSKLIAVAALVATAATLATVAAAGPVAARQRVAIQLTEHSSVLTPLTAGAIKPDSVVPTFCCWSTRHTMRDGQAIDIENPQMTLTGKRGTLVVRNRIEWVDLPDGWAVMTGTWKVISGTGAYAGLSGGGRGAAVAPANGHGKSRFEGFLTAN
jgi:hypothetical protein